MTNNTDQLRENIKIKQDYNKSLKSIILKYKDGRKERESIVEFEQPCCILLRNNMNAEFLESNKHNGLKSTIFKYKHSNGDAMEVNLKGSPLFKLPFGQKEMLTYIHHEDWFTPINSFFSSPHAPIDEFNSKIEHSFSAVNKWQVEKAKANALSWKWMVAGVAVLAVGFILYKMLVPSTAVQGLQQAAQNVTVIYALPPA